LNSTANSSGFFPLKLLRKLWAEVEPRDYEYSILPWNLMRAVMTAFVCRLSGLRAMVERHGQRLGTTNYSSLSPALARASSLTFLKRMLECLQDLHTPRRGDLVAIDGMAVTLPKTQRHNCAKVNHKTVGGGVVWAYMINAAKGVCPVRILKMIQGAWHDSTVMRQVALIAGVASFSTNRCGAWANPARTAAFTLSGTAWRDWAARRQRRVPSCGWSSRRCPRARN
jgi:hypothetical protein